MSAWGKKERVTVSGTVNFNGNIITAGATGALSALKPGYSVFGATGFVGYMGMVKTVNENRWRAELFEPVYGATGPFNNVAIFVSESPKYINPKEGKDVYFVDTEETNVTKGGQHSGWVKVTRGTGGRAGRKLRETLVAMGVPKSESNDRENTEFPS